MQNWLKSSLMALFPVAAAAASLNVSVGGKVIALPVPAGMQDVAQRGTTVRRVIESGIPEELRVLACFLPAADAGMFDYGKANRLDRHVIVVTYRAEEGQEKTESSFATFQQVTAESQDRKRGTPQATTLIERSRNVYSYVGLRDRPANESTREPARRIVSAPLIVRVNGRQISYFIYANYRDAGDIAWARRVASTLSREIFLANR